jgi:O-antigen/teichoic acid export membrane protein
MKIALNPSIGSTHQFKQSLFRSIASQPGLRRWSSRGLTAILDQGLFATANFSLNILLARWMEPEAYGAFVVAYSIFLLFAVVHTELLEAPLAVLGPGRYSGAFERYVTIVIAGHVVVTCAIGLVIAIGSIAVGKIGATVLAQALAAAAVATPAVLFAWVMRRACYARSRQGWATAGSALYLAIILSGSFGLYRLGALTAVSALLTTAVAGASVGIWLTFRLRPRLRALGGDPSPRIVAGEHWRLGKWLVPTGILWLFPPAAIYTLLPMWGGLDDSAALRAAHNGILPLLQINAALGAILVPAMSQAWRANAKAQFLRLTRAALLVLIGVASLYTGFLAVFGSRIAQLLYADRYEIPAELFILVGAIGVPAAILTVFSSALRAQERADTIYRAALISTIVALIGGIGLLAGFGVVGAAAGLLLWFVSSALILTFYSFRASRSTRRIR